MFFKYGAIALLFFSSQVVATDKQPQNCPGYKAEDVQNIGQGLRASLTLAGPPCNVYGTDIDQLTLTVTFDTRDRLHVNIQDAVGKQYQIPKSVLALDGQHGSGPYFPSLQFKHFHDAKYGFGFKVLRQNGEAIFDTTGHPLIFEDQYIEITSGLPANANLYGIGEAPDFFRHNTTNTIKTLWSRESAGEFGKNSYGSHTVYMELRKGKFHGAYLHNSHGMDIVLANQAIQYRVLGGTADFYFFNGPSALDVIDQYTELVGRPGKVPYWSLGFHNCRYGYKSVYVVNEVIANYSKARIPLESVWSDVDYMDTGRGFTFDPVNYPLPAMQKQLEYLHAHNQKRVLIIHPAIQHNHSYAPYARGESQEVFARNADKSEYITQAWPGYSVLPDWFAKNAGSWWQGELGRFMDELPIDGMWISMNEPSAFCTGSCGTGKPENVRPPYPWDVTNPPPHRPLNYSNHLLVPPYAIHQVLEELSDNTLETSSINANGIAAYYTHNLYGHMHSKATYNFLSKYRPGIRPFILSPGTFAGSGQYVSHWSGDNESKFFDLHLSISTMLSFGIFGIPMMGSDVCGFAGNASEELCARWIEMGAFYPFSRTHNSYYSTPQELYRWPKVAEISRQVLGIRYSLLPYIYTNLQLSTEKGWPLARALVFEYPQVIETSSIDRQFMLGDGLLISPVLTEGAVSVDAFFPKGIWYSWQDYTKINGANAKVTLSAELGHINLHVRGGKILPAQFPALTTTDSRQNDFFLVVAADANNCSEGRMFIDDGQTINSPHRWVDFKYVDNMLFIKPTHGSYEIGPSLTRLVLLGVPGVRTVKVNWITADGFNVTHTNGSTVVDGLKINLNHESVVSFDYY